MVPTPFMSAEGVNTSTSGLLNSLSTPPESSPATMITRPSGSSVRVGYQRPSRMRPW